jgi:hypothetical protein
MQPRAAPFVKGDYRFDSSVSEIIKALAPSQTLPPILKLSEISPKNFKICHFPYTLTFLKKNWTKIEKTIKTNQKLLKEYTNSSSQVEYEQNITEKLQILPFSLLFDVFKKILNKKLRKQFTCLIVLIKSYNMSPRTLPLILKLSEISLKNFKFCEFRYFFTFLNKMKIKFLENNLLSW